MIVKKEGKDLVGLVFEKEAIDILMVTAPLPKDNPKNLRRLARIRTNLFRELSAINKEIKRFRFKDVIKLK